MRPNYALTPYMRQLLTRLPIALATLFAGSAYACKPREAPNQEQLIAEAQDIVRARIESVVTKEVPAAECDAVVCTYVEVRYGVLERFKGSKSRTGTFKSAECGTCSFCFEADQEYVLYIDRESVVYLFNGSALLDSDDESADLIRSLRKRFRHNGTGA